MAYEDYDMAAGKLGLVKVGGVELGINGWNFTPEMKIEDTTNTFDWDPVDEIQFESHVSTSMSGKGNFKADWDIAAIPTAVAPNLFPGEDIALKLYLSTDVYIDIPHATVTSLPIVSEVKGKISYTCEFTANGPFTMPS